jgi:hypothetical protein
MTLEVTLRNLNVMPAQAGIHDFLQQTSGGSLSRGFRGAPRGAFAGMTGLVGQSPWRLVLIPEDLGDDSSRRSSGIARGDGGAAARKKDSYTKGHFQ